MSNLFIPRYVDTIDTKEVKHIRAICDELCTKMFRLSVENKMLKFMLKHSNLTRDQILNNFQMEFYKENEKLLPRSYFANILASIDIDVLREEASFRDQLSNATIQ